MPRKAFGRIKWKRKGRGTKRKRTTSAALPASMRGYVRTSGYYNHPELKFFDLDLDDAVIATGGTITDSLNKIPQGTTESQRGGRKCTITSVTWKYWVAIPEIDAVATPSAGDTVRLILYVDKQANGATAAVTDILESADWQSFYNLANSKRFRIICDKLHTLNYATLASDGAGVVSSAELAKDAEVSYKLNLPVEFSSTTGAITEIRSNNLGILLISNAGLAGLFSKIRLRFVG